MIKSSHLGKTDFLNDYTNYINLLNMNIPKYLNDNEKRIVEYVRYLNLEESTLNVYTYLFDEKLLTMRGQFVGIYKIIKEYNCLVINLAMNINTSYGLLEMFRSKSISLEDLAMISLLKHDKLDKQLPYIMFQ